MAHKAQASKAAIIGDVTGSRQTGDREDLQRALQRAMDQANEAVPPIQRLTMTVGDEFQAMYSTIAEASQAALRIRLDLWPEVDVRIGIGWGELTLEPLNPPFGQDGPCWWRAREAIEEVKAAEQSNSVPRSVRTRCRTGSESDSLINAYLSNRDQVLSGFDELDVTIANLRIKGMSQKEIANEVGLAQSSISRRLQTHGILTILNTEPDVIPVVG